MTTEPTGPKRIISTDRAPAPAGAYSQAVEVLGLVHLAGQTPRLPDGARLNDQSFEVQARQAFANLQAVAEAAGTSLSNAVSMMVFLADLEDRFVCDEVWREFFTQPFPARAIVQSDLPGFAIEVTGVCVAGQGLVGGDQPQFGPGSRLR